MTATELADLYEAVHALFDRYSRRERSDPPPGSRPVTLRFQAFPDD
jgi:hypothetical protein